LVVAEKMIIQNIKKNMAFYLIFFASHDVMLT